MTSIPTKIRPRSTEGRTDGRADLAIPRGHLGRLGATADMHVRPGLAKRRDAVDDADRLALDQDDALVALADLGQVALDNEGLAIDVFEDLE